MCDLDTVKIGRGLGDLVFGFSREDVVELLGQPEEIVDCSSGVENHIQWHYRDAQISLYFEGEYVYVLDTVSCDRPSCRLRNHVLIGRTMEEIRTLISTEGLGPSAEEAPYVRDKDGEISLFECGKQSLNFWFNDGLVVTVQWGPLFKDEDTIIWPRI